MRSKLLAILVAIVLGPSLLLMASAGVYSEATLEESDGLPQWPMASGDAKHQCLSPFDEASINGSTRWEISLGDRDDSTYYLLSSIHPIIGSDGTVYVSSYNGILYAIDRRGEEIWKTSTNLTEYNQAKPMTPAIDDDGNLYIPKLYRIKLDTGDGGYSYNNYYAIESRTSNGEFRWSYTLTSSFDDISAVTIDDGRVFFTAMQETYNMWQTTERLFLYALSSEGDYLWIIELEGSVGSTPAVGDDGTIYVGTTDGLAAILPNGTLAWTFPCPAVDYPPSIGDDGTIYFGCTDTQIYALHPNGTLKWSFDTSGPVMAPVALSGDGRILIGSFDRHVYAVDENGSELWRYLTNGMIFGITIDASGDALISSRNTPLTALDSEGNQIWNYSHNLNLHRYSAAVIDAEGAVYVFDYDATLHHLGSSEPSPPSEVIAMMTDEGVEIIWTLPSYEGSSPMLGLHLYRGANVTGAISLYNIDEQMELLEVLPPDQSHYNDPDGRLYHSYALVAFNEVDPSDVSNLANVIDPEEPFIFFPDLMNYQEILEGTALFIVVVLGVLLVLSLFTKGRETSLAEMIGRPLRTMIGMLIRPGRTFEKSREGTLTQAIFYFIGGELVFVGASVLLEVTLRQQNIFLPFLNVMNAESVLGTFFALMILLILALILMSIILWLANFACRPFRPEGGYDETAKSILYGSTPAYLFGWMPFLLLIPAVWSLALQGMGFMKLHKMTASGAAGALILTFVMILLLALFISLAFLSG